MASQITSNSRQELVQASNAMYKTNIDGIMQQRRNSIADALELTSFLH